MNDWLQAHLPPILLERGPARLLLWQWLALPLLFLVSWGLGGLLSRVARRLLRSIAHRTTVTWDDALLEKLRAPLTLAASVSVAWLCLPLLSLADTAHAWLLRAFRAMFFAALFWGILRALSVIAATAMASTWAAARPASAALVPLASRVATVALSGFALVALLAELGYPVASLIAGLGIGGLAIALAGQKTVENLFGAFSIGIDQPFREGDFVKIEDFVGTVEAIGLRSTKVRTLDRTLISIPNGKLADMRLESFTARDRIRLACTLGVVYETTAAQMREILDGLERVLREHPKVWQDAIIVRFKEFGDSALLIEIMAWFLTQDFGEFQLMRQGVLLDFMGVIERAGSSFAFPTRTVHLVHNPAPRDPGNG
jgi:MscS family membrane protein